MLLLCQQKPFIRKHTTITHFFRNLYKKKSVGEVSKAKDRKPAVRGVLLMRGMSSINLANIPAYESVTRFPFKRLKLA